MAEDTVQGVNYLTNLYLRAFYSYHFLSEILQQDELLQDYSRKFEYSSKVAQSNAQVMSDYLHKKDLRFVLMEPPRILDFDLKKAVELDKTIRYCVKRLERLGSRDSDDDLLQILKSKTVKPTASMGKVFKISEETKFKYVEQRYQLIQTDLPLVEGKKAETEAPRPSAEKNDPLAPNFQDNPPNHDTSVETEYDVVIGLQEQLHDDSGFVSSTKDLVGDGGFSTSSKDVVEVSIGGDAHSLKEDSNEGPGCGECPSNISKEISEASIHKETSTSNYTTATCSFHSVKESSESRKSFGQYPYAKAECIACSYSASTSLQESTEVLEMDDKEESNAGNSSTIVAAAAAAVAVAAQESADPSLPGRKKFKKNMTFKTSTMEVPMALQLEWEEVPRKVVLIKKLREPSANDGFIDMVLWLAEKYPEMELLLESHALNEDSMKKNSRIKDLRRACRSFTEKDDVGEDDDVDIVISFGGDGTLLHAVSLFPRQMPPVVGFRTGTLNFMVPFKFERGTFKNILKDVFAGKVLVNLRSRIEYTVKSNDGGKSEYTAMNEIAVTRGCNPHLCKVEISMNCQKLATIEGDGILICTPTGSTAYSLAAGGAVLHPSVPCMQIVPIAPHSICTRSIVVPANAEIIFKLAETCRGDAVVTSDGIHSFKMGKQDSLHLMTSSHPLPIIYRLKNKDEMEQPSDWLKSFHWCQKLDPPEDEGNNDEKKSQQK